MPSASQKKFLTSATNQYAKDLAGSPAEEYLAERSVSLEAARTARLGFVRTPEPGHDMYAGMLSIPYWTKTGVVAVKFRRLDDGHPKYLWPNGQESSLFNVRAVLSGEPYVAICEGELDTVTAHFVCGVNAIGVSGANHWRKHYARVLKGFQEVFVVTDNDPEKEGRNAGQELANRIVRDIPWARNVLLPVGVDVSDLTRERGRDALPELLGLDAKPVTDPGSEDGQPV